MLIELHLSGHLGGRPVAWTTVDRIVLEDGKIKERHAYFDPAPLLKAMLLRPQVSLPLLPSLCCAAAEASPRAAARVWKAAAVMSVTDELLENNRRWAESFDKRGLSNRPAKKVAIVACMDARFLPSRVLGVEEGDAHIIRNAGGVVTDDEIRSLAISQHLLGTEEIILIHHTNCGLEGIGEEEIRAQLREAAGRRPTMAGRGVHRRGRERARVDPPDQPTAPSSATRTCAASSTTWRTGRCARSPEASREPARRGYNRPTPRGGAVR